MPTLNTSAAPIAESADATSTFKEFPKPSGDSVDWETVKVPDIPLLFLNLKNQILLH